jgi:hypothetical protein
MRAYLIVYLIGIASTQYMQQHSICPIEASYQAKRRTWGDGGPLAKIMNGPNGKCND